jgi:virginiamycin B lyase
MCGYDQQKISGDKVLKTKYSIAIGIVLLLLCGMGIFLTSGNALGFLHQPPTPTPYIVPVRGPEIPLSTHRFQSLQSEATPTRFNPWGIAIDQLHGFVWVAEPGCDMAPTCLQTFPAILGKYSLTDGSLLDEYQEPPNYSSPLFVAVAPDGVIWFTQPNTDAIGSFDPQTTLFAQYSVKKNSAPYDLLIDKNGNIWFTEFKGNAIGFLDRNKHTLVETPVPTAESNPYGITQDSKGTIWFVENAEDVGKIGSFTPTASGGIAIAEHAVDAHQPHLITSDKAGNIWFSEAFAGDVGKFNPVDGTTTNYKVTPPCVTHGCSGVHISGIAVDKNGNVWFTDSLAGVIGYLVPATGAIVKKIFSTANVHPHDGLVIDGYNTVWFTLEYGRALNMWPGARIPAK